ncbi:MAG: hypothetical protein MJ245_02415 [Clostridia bacterium]|nr:hypothetical protein [Clostridia bacterium]
MYNSDFYLKAEEYSVKKDELTKKLVEDKKKIQDQYEDLERQLNIEYSSKMLAMKEELEAEATDSGYRYDVITDEFVEIEGLDVSEILIAYSNDKGIYFEHFIDKLGKVYSDQFGIILSQKENKEEILSVVKEMITAYNPTNLDLLHKIEPEFDDIVSVNESSVSDLTAAGVEILFSYGNLELRGTNYNLWMNFFRINPNDYKKVKKSVRKSSGKENCIF